MIKRGCLLIVLILVSSAYADFASRVEHVKERIEDAKCQLRYYSPYALASTIGLSSSALGNKGAAVVCAFLGVYAFHSAYTGYKKIKEIENKYNLTTKAADYWNSFYTDEPFLFSRWRQLDDRYGDGYYWPTAWLCHEERKKVREILIQDIHAQRIEIMCNGKKINNPTPSQVIGALQDELFELETDKKKLQAYTTIYRTVEQPEAFHPDITIKRLFWPNYNRASQLYIEVVQMMKRLEVIRDIVARIRAETAGDRWPRA